MPAEQAEPARATMLALFPEGFEEVERGAVLELAAYTEADGAARLWRAFGEFSASDVAEGWAERWRRFHRPVRIGPVWVGPPWHRPPASAHAVVIDPGRAFGTGAHETTRLCVELLVDAPRGALLDVGCGSGVLAIAGAALGFGPVTAVDHDPAAVEATRANAAANGAPLRVRALDALADPLPAADLVVANLSLAAVERLAVRLDAAALVTSGYLSSEVPRLDGFVHRERRVAAAWAADRWARAS